MKRRNIVGIWLLILISLIILANVLPTVKNINKNQNYVYEHPQDKYTINITGLWQVYSEGKTSLTLVNLDNDSTITFNLEVGGYDYLSPEDSAKELLNHMGDKIKDIKVIEKPAQGIIGTYKSIAMIVQYNQGANSFYGEEAIIHPNEGIRLYVSFIYPKNTKSEIIKEGETIIQSVQFTNTEDLYAKFMQQ
ncbi:MAG: hypothetical protein RSB05_01365 [Clostridiales bacterium]